MEEKVFKCKYDVVRFWHTMQDIDKWVDSLKSDHSEPDEIVFAVSVETKAL